MPEFVLRVNGRVETVEVALDTPLLWVLRDSLGLTGTKFGCGGGYCRACTVQIDGELALSCLTRASGLGDREILTIEGLSSGTGHALRAAWVAEEVPQCGYCQSGQIMAAAGLLASNPSPSDDEIDAWMSPNLCRCGTYNRVRRAIRRAANERS